MKRILLFMALAVVMLFGVSHPMNAEAKTATITVKKADTKTLKKIDKQLKKGKTFYLDVKGSSKTKSKKLIKKASQSIGKVNEYSVQFHYGSPKKSKKGYYRYKVSADNAKLYKYTIQLLTDCYTNCTFTEYVEKTIAVDEYFQDGTWYNTRYETKTEEIVQTYYKKFGNKKFCDISTLQQARVVTKYIDRNRIEYGDPLDMQKNRHKYTDSQLMKRLIDKKAHGACGDFALYKMLVFDQIGIESGYYYGAVKSGSHAMVIFKAINSSGKTMWIQSDYTEWGRPTFLNDWTVKGASSKKIKEIKTNATQYTLDDIREALRMDEWFYDKDGYVYLE